MGFKEKDGSDKWYQSKVGYVVQRAECPAAVVQGERWVVVLDKKGVEKLTTKAMQGSKLRGNKRLCRDSKGPNVQEASRYDDHQLATMDRSTKSEPNAMVAEHKRTTAYRTEVTAATGGGGKEEEKIKK
ncbi:hypothetical protein Acr_00g0048650 [Actinidia rufa]|uniref:Uncharacterized protein n=1 Tax=Actinidia rufa TaxID=165716 RepID=A0A7J0DLY1_9ERIC|nr:hypothetical protein Acr_00g0048650 [Actinidia rufa]